MKAVSMVLGGILLAAVGPVDTGYGETLALRGKILDARSGDLLPARLTIESLDRPGEFHHAKGGRAAGEAVPYEKRRRETSIEIHTCLPAGPFEVNLPPGRYVVTARRGTEYVPARVEIDLEDDEGADIGLKLERWIHMAGRGWFSGDTHCHRSLEDLPTVLLAEDLNVGLPLTAWVTDTAHTPLRNNRGPLRTPPAELVRVGKNHVIWPINTEYEIFSVNGKRHPLGAVFVLNHRDAFDLAVPPLRPVAQEARRQGAILDLDKHNWPWSMSIIPVMDVDLFELTNNHLWRTDFAFTSWYTEFVGDYMDIPMRREGDGKHLDERGWIDFGFQTYYALLNCGLRIMPSGGTASGVHPVPLGFGRVYVRMPDAVPSLDYDDWIDGLRAGRSFVTTGPMLFMEVGGEPPGSTIAWDETKDTLASIRVESRHPIEKLELLVNGEATGLDLSEVEDSEAPHSGSSVIPVSVERTSWVAARVFTRTEEGRPRFAHSAPVWVEVKDAPLRPKREEAEYLLKRVRDEIDRHRNVLPEDALAEMEEAASFFESKRIEAAVD